MVTTVIKGLSKYEYVGKETQSLSLGESLCHLQQGKVIENQ